MVGSISDRGLIAVTTFVLVFLFTGSVLLPIKALVMNVLALSTVLGVVTPSPSGCRWTTSCS